MEDHKFAAVVTEPGKLVQGPRRRSGTRGVLGEGRDTCRFCPVTEQVILAVKLKVPTLQVPWFRRTPTSERVLGLEKSKGV